MIDSLLLNFASGHPEDVAKIMPDHPASESVELLELLPVDSATRVIARLLSRQLSEVLELIDSNRLAAMLINGSPGDVMTLVSHMSTGCKETALSGASEADQAMLRRLFHAPLRTLSSIATPEFIRVNSKDLCRDVRTEIISSDNNFEIPLFVVNERGAYEGTAPLFMVLQEKNSELPVSSITLQTEALSGQMPVAAAVAAPQWAQFRVLPVVDGQLQIIGALTFEQLLQARHGINDDTVGLEAMIGQVATSYFDVCVDLMEMTVGGKQYDAE